MNVSMDWLGDWIDLDDLDPTDLAHRLTMAGLEVDGLDFVGEGHDDIVVGEIVAIEEHPDADRLVVCIVDAGEEGRQRTIVCGATNMETGDRVPTALPGTSPPGIDFDIEAREVMGIGSEGMLCSAEELDFSDDSDGLLILEGNEEPGTPIFDALGMRDVILEFDLTPNRADCLSHLGVAREIAAIYGRDLRAQRLEGARLEELGLELGPATEVAGLDVDDDVGCPQYRMAILEDVEVSTSPPWLRRRLESVGLRPVNSVVDVTNFVLMDVGQPLHAFDLDRLAGPEIVVRRAEDGEELVGIDHEEYELAEDDLVIADAEKPVALAGVMGGAETEVGESTTRILLECAEFDPTTVRRSSKRHGLHTDSSHRFERGIDTGGVERALRYAVDLLVEVQDESTGSVPGVCADTAVAGGATEDREPIDVDVDRVVELLGVELGGDQCEEYLERLGVGVTGGSGTLTCRVPSFRNDLGRPVDLIEEIARLHGYDEIPVELPALTLDDHRRSNREDAGETIVSTEVRGQLDWVRSFLLDRGLMEAANYSFMGEDDLERLGLEDDPRKKAARLANPLIASQAMMRTTLIPSLLDNVQTNFARRRQDVALFEIGRRYLEDEERRTLALAVTGRRRRHWEGDREWDFYDAKGIVESLATPWSVADARWERPDDLEPYLHPGIQAVWRIGDRPVGVVGRLHPEVEREEDFEQPVLVAEIDLEALLDAPPRRPRAEPPAKYPAVVRDFALLYDEDRPYAELRDAVDGLCEDDETFGAIFEALEVFDVYEGPQVPEGRRSIAIEVTYRSDERTLEDDDVDAADRQLLSHLEAVVDAELR